MMAMMFIIIVEAWEAWNEVVIYTGTLFLSVYLKFEMEVFAEISRMITLINIVTSLVEFPIGYVP